MKLISAKIHGYKRLACQSSINLDGKLIAIVGPNEAGKSSLLKALQHLNHHDAFVKSGSSQELTRGRTISNEQRVVEATFLLEEADKSAVAHIEDTSKLRWLIVYKIADGKYYADALPKPERDLSHRQTVVRALQNLREPIKESGIKVGFQKQDDPLLRVDKLIAALNVSDEQLSKDVVAEIKSIAVMFLSSGLAAVIKSLQNLAQELDGLAADEEKTPHNSAMQILFNRRPKFLFFDEEARSLQSNYDLDEVGEDPPVALANLTRVAKLDLKNLRSALTEDDQGQVETIIDAANKKIKQVFSTSWSQSNVTVRLRVSDKVLHILVGSPRSSCCNR